MPPLPTVDNPKPSTKPRRRHSPAQLAALNELFEQDEHPPLELRTSLADRLGMETKTVNAWFQNKRASSKKKSSTRPAAYEPPPSSSLSSSSSTVDRIPEKDDFELDSQHFDLEYTRSWSSSFYAGNPNHTHFLSESDNMPKRMRMRPSQEQTEELKNLYNINPHPTTDERQALADRIGMRYQSITNWFQNQRSIAKKKKEDDEATFALAAESRTYSAFPPPAKYPHPPPSTHPSLPQGRPRSPSLSPADDHHLFSRRSNPRRSVTPYSTSSRPKRSRPEPYQLDALKDLFTKTPNPSIEERTALAQEIGMDLGRVTNWFRNLRQTSRKRASKKEEDMASGDEDYSPHATSVSRSRSASPSSSPSPSLDGVDMTHSDVGSDDEYEAFTPSPESSPAPQGRKLEKLVITFDPVLHAEAEQATKNVKNGIQAEDILLLLSFHQHSTTLSC